MADLAAWDSTRYGSLGDSNDGQSYDIFTQAAQAIRADSATLLGGLTPKRVFGLGDSQSAFRVDTYVNAIQPLTHAFDGFIAVGRAAVTAPIGSGLISSFPLPALIRSDNTMPFTQLNTEGDILELGAGLSRQPDNNYLRTWELAGAAHIDAHEGAYELATLARDQPTVPVPRCVFGTPIEGTGTPLGGINQVNNMPLFEADDAALAALQNWVVQGVQPPHSPRISTTPLFGGLPADQPRQVRQCPGRNPAARDPVADGAIFADRLLAGEPE
jgi:Alpha/beta hydrolase domain